MSQAVKDTILQDFSRTPGGEVLLRLKDPEYVRSEVIVLDRSTRNLYVVVEGASYMVGRADDDLASILRHNDSITLTAPHYYSGELSMRSRVSVH